ncbi:MAG: stress response translation initiation inhibitor YciH [Pseudomonadota bacterium]
MSKNKDSRLVYSTEQGRVRHYKRADDNQSLPSTNSPAAGDGVVRLHRQTKGRGGKAVTIITGIPLVGAELKALAKNMKARCGVGGAIKDGNIEIQGDQRAQLRAMLEEAGYTVKIAGG